MMRDNLIQVQPNKSNLIQQLAEMQEMIQNTQNQTNNTNNKGNTPYHHQTPNAVMQHPQMNPHLQQQQYQPMNQQPITKITNQQFHPFQYNNKNNNKKENTVRGIKEVVQKFNATSKFYLY
eukprot:3329930-Ditylum_brightwellii.AAC.1